MITLTQSLNINRRSCSKRVTALQYQNGGGANAATINYNKQHTQREDVGDKYCYKALS